ncbi:MAG TPA: response regulator [Pyrinomonadaceae bacterium]|jgi:chemosensory pili system protein ChpA (sensor histidine kinase/response regulator)|nr:response regulator [Pyrinomonadaceae bacterium]
MHFPRTASDIPSASGAHAARAGAPDAGRPDGQHTILVAEDDPDIRLMMKTLLLMRGYRVVEARDGQEAVDVARATRPDLILMDLQLPKLNGFAVARFVRTTDSLRSVPIIVVSAHDPVKHRGLAFAAGCNAYVQKPIEFDRLDEIIVGLLPRE